MKFHLPSFLLGIAVGGATAAAAPRLRPVALELLTVGYKTFDRIGIALARKREDLLAATERELVEQDWLRTTADFKEGIASTAERRTPRFLGR